MHTYVYGHDNGKIQHYFWLNFLSANDVEFWARNFKL
jgi:hypothetical protein